MVFYVHCITEDHTAENLRSEFRTKKSGKEWEMLILSAKEAWEVVHSAIREENDSTITDAADDEGDMSFLPDPPSTHPCSPLTSRARSLRTLGGISKTT